METAIANQLEKRSLLITNEIVKNPTSPALFHSGFDNFDQYINDVKGAGSIHTAHGIMLQEVESTNNPPILEDMSPVDRTKERSIHLSINSDLPECFLTKRKSPVINMTKINGIEDQTAFTLSNTQDLVYKFVRGLCQSQQILPSYSGFISMVSDPPKSLTKIVYYPVIQKPITEYSTVKEVLRYSEEASKEVGQSIVITTFDLGVCMKAYPLVWNSQKKYKNHIIMIGTFHLIMAYFKNVWIWF